MPDLDVVHDPLEFDLEQAGSDQGPIPILTSPPEKTWIWSDIHLADRASCSPSTGRSTMSSG